AGDEGPDLSAGTPPRGNAGRCPAAHVEFPRRNHDAAGRIPPSRRAVHRADTVAECHVIMRVAVTGAGGFVGAPLVRCLLANGCDIAALVRSPAALDTFADVRHRLTCITGDLRSDAVGRALELFRPDACIHAAWYA